MIGGFFRGPLPPLVAMIVFAWIGYVEWLYRRRHPYAHGLSGELIALSVSGFLLAGHALAVAWQRRAEAAEANRRFLQRYARDDDLEA